MNRDDVIDQIIKLKYSGCIDPDKLTKEKLSKEPDDVLAIILSVEVKSSHGTNI